MNWIDQAAEWAAVEEPKALREVTAVPGRMVAIDADFLAYFCGGGPSPGVARQTMRQRIERFKKYSGAERAILCLTADGCLKGDRPLVSVTKPYQANRKGGQKPKHWALLRDDMESGRVPLADVAVFTDREADDGIVYLAQHHNAVIATKDKDMRMSWGLHINWDTYEMTKVARGAYRHTEWGREFGLYFFCQQMLMGDRVDNIPGLGFKTGPATAAKMLIDTETFEEGWAEVCHQYQSHYPETWAELVVEQAILLWMRTDRQGLLLDFLNHVPKDDNYEELLQAGSKIRNRVAEMKKEANELQTQASGNSGLEARTTKEAAG